MGIEPIASSSQSTLSQVSRMSTTEESDVEPNKLLDALESEEVMSRTLLLSSVSSINSALLKPLGLRPMFYESK